MAPQAPPAPRSEDPITAVNNQETEFGAIEASCRANVFAAKGGGDACAEVELDLSDDIFAAQCLGHALPTHSIDRAWVTGLVENFKTRGVCKETENGYSPLYIVLDDASWDTLQKSDSRMDSLPSNARYRFLDGMHRAEARREHNKLQCQSKRADRPIWKARVYQPGILRQHLLLQVWLAERNSPVLGQKRNGTQQLAFRRLYSLYQHGVDYAFDYSKAQKKPILLEHYSAIAEEAKQIDNIHSTVRRFLARCHTLRAHPVMETLNQLMLYPAMWTLAWSALKDALGASPDFARSQLERVLLEIWITHGYPTDTQLVTGNSRCIQDCTAETAKALQDVATPLGRAGDEFPDSKVQEARNQASACLLETGKASVWPPEAERDGAIALLDGITLRTTDIGSQIRNLAPLLKYPQVQRMLKPLGVIVGPKKTGRSTEQHDPMSAFIEGLNRVQHSMEQCDISKSVQISAEQDVPTAVATLILSELLSLSVQKRLADDAVSQAFVPIASLLVAKDQSLAPFLFPASSPMPLRSSSVATETDFRASATPSPTGAADREMEMSRYLADELEMGTYIATKPVSHTIHHEGSSSAKVMAGPAFDSACVRYEHEGNESGYVTDVGMSAQPEETSFEWSTFSADALDPPPCNQQAIEDYSEWSAPSLSGQIGGETMELDEGSSDRSISQGALGRVMPDGVPPNAVEVRPDVDVRMDFQNDPNGEAEDDAVYDSIEREATCGTGVRHEQRQQQEQLSAAVAEMDLHDVLPSPPSVEQARQAVLQACPESVKEKLDKRDAAPQPSGSEPQDSSDMDDEPQASSHVGISDTPNMEMGGNDLSSDRSKDGATYIPAINHAPASGGRPAANSDGALAPAAVAAAAAAPDAAPAAAPGSGPNPAASAATPPSTRAASPAAASDTASNTAADTAPATELGKRKRDRVISSAGSKHPAKRRQSTRARPHSVQTPGVKVCYAISISSDSELGDDPESDADSMDSYPDADHDADGLGPADNASYAEHKYTREVLKRLESAGLIFDEGGVKVITASATEDQGKKSPRQDSDVVKLPHWHGLHVEMLKIRPSKREMWRHEQLLVSRRKRWMELYRKLCKAGVAMGDLALPGEVEISAGNRFIGPAEELQSDYPDVAYDAAMDEAAPSNWTPQHFFSTGSVNAVVNQLKILQAECEEDVAQTEMLASLTEFTHPMTFEEEARDAKSSLVKRLIQASKPPPESWFVEYKADLDMSEINSRPHPTILIGSDPEPTESKSRFTVAGCQPFLHPSKQVLKENVQIVDGSQADNVQASTYILAPVRRLTDLFSLRDHSIGSPLNLLDLRVSKEAEKHESLSQHVTASCLLRRSEKLGTNDKQDPLPRITALRWALMSSPGAFSTYHVDANGLPTFINVTEGIKLWFFVVPKDGQSGLIQEGSTPLEKSFISLTELAKAFSNCSNDAELTIELDKFHIYMVPLCRGVSALMPPSTLHAVFTPVTTCTIGTHFLRPAHLPLQVLARSFESMLGHLITNTTHRHLPAALDLLFATEIEALSKLAAEKLPQVLQAKGTLLDELAIAVRFAPFFLQSSAEKGDVPPDFTYVVTKHLAKESKEASVRRRAVTALQQYANLQEQVGLDVHSSLQLDFTFSELLQKQKFLSASIHTEEAIDKHLDQMYERLAKAVRDQAREREKSGDLPKYLKQGQVKKLLSNWKALIKGDKGKKKATKREKRMKDESKVDTELDDST